MASAMIGNLAVSLTMNTAAFQRGATIAEKRTEAMRGRFAAATTSVKGLGAAIGVGLGADVLYRITAGAFQMASALSESAEKAGVSVEALQELQFAAKQTGVSTETLEGATRRLNNSLGQLELGGKAATKAFAALGLTAADLAGKSFQEQLGIIADALNKLPTAQQRVAIGQQIMGRSFSELLPLLNGGSAALESYSAKAREAGIVTAEEAATLDKAADDWEEFKGRVLVVTAQLFAGAIRLGDQMTAWTQKLHYQLVDLRIGFEQMVLGSLAAVAKLVNGVRDWVTGALDAVWDSAISKIRTVEAAFKWLYDKVVGHSWVPDMVQKIGYEMGTLAGTMADQAEAVTVRVSKSFKDMADSTLSALSRLTSSIKSGGFLGILEAVIGFGLQLGTIGAFGKGISNRLNGVSAGGGFVSPGKGGGGGAQIQVVPSPYFDLVVDQRAVGVVTLAAPSISKGTLAQASYQNSRRLA